MQEDKIKKTFSKNLIELRKSRRLTQLQLAEKLNYSDKSISKWECGDVLPDIVTFTNIAEFFGTTVDKLLSENMPVKNASRKRNVVITMLAFGLTWFIASVVFFVLSALGIERSWLVYIAALPVSFTVVVVLSCIWFNNIVKCFTVSALLWGFAVAVHVFTAEYHLWFIYVVATIFEVLVIWWFLLRRYNRLVRQAKKELQNDKDVGKNV